MDSATDLDADEDFDYATAERQYELGRAILNLCDTISDLKSRLSPMSRHGASMLNSDSEDANRDGWRRYWTMMRECSEMWAEYRTLTPDCPNYRTWRRQNAA